MAVLIDTDVLLEWERGAAAGSFERIAPGEERALSAVTVSELLHGVRRARGARRTKRRAFVEHVLAAIEPIPITAPVARVHAEAWAELEARGTAVGAHDLWIAATALAHGYGVMTRNAVEFGRVRGLRVVSVG